MKRKSNKMLSVFLATSMVLNNGMALNAQEASIMPDTNMSSNKHSNNNEEEKNVIDTDVAEKIGATLELKTENTVNTLGIMNADNILKNVLGEDLANSVKLLGEELNTNYTIDSVAISSGNDLTVTINKPLGETIKKVVVNDESFNVTESDLYVSRYANYFDITKEEIVTKAKTTADGKIDATTVKLKVIFENGTYIEHNGAMENNLPSYKAMYTVSANLDAENNLTISTYKNIDEDKIKTISINNTDVDKSKFTIEGSTIKPKNENKDEILNLFGDEIKNFTDRTKTVKINLTYIDDSNSETDVILSKIADQYALSKVLLKNNNTVEITFDKQIDKEKISRVAMSGKEVDNTKITTKDENDKTTFIINDEEFVNAVKSSSEEYETVSIAFLDKSQKEHSVVNKKEVTKTDVSIEKPALANDWRGDYLKIAYKMLTAKQLEKEDIKKIFINGKEFSADKIYSVDKKTKYYGENEIKVQDEEALGAYKENTNSPTIKIVLQDDTFVEYAPTAEPMQPDMNTTHSVVSVKYTKENRKLEITTNINFEKENVKEIKINDELIDLAKFTFSDKVISGANASIIDAVNKTLESKNIKVEVKLKDNTVTKFEGAMQVIEPAVVPVEEKKLKAEYNYGSLVITRKDYRSISDIKEIKVNGQTFKVKDGMFREDYSNPKIIKSDDKDILKAVLRQKDNIALDIVYTDETISNGVTHPQYTETTPQPVKPNKKGMTSEQINNLFSITELGTGSDGGKVFDIATGKEIDYTGHSIVIGFEYLGEHETPYKFFKEENTLTNIYIDDVEYPVSDISDGMSFYVLKKSSINIYDKYQSGIDAYNDFIKREKHKVILVFNNNTVISKKDDGYVDKPVTKYGGGTPTPLPGANDNNGNNDNIPSQPITPAKPGEGVAKNYKIDSTAIKYFSLKIKISPKISDEDIKRIKTLKINGVEISKEKLPDLRRTYSDELETGENIALDAAKKQNDIAIEIIFDDGSVLKNDVSVGNNTKPIDDGNVTASDFKILSDEVEIETDFEGDDFVKIPYEKVTGKPLSKDKIKYITIDGKEYLSSKIDYSLIDAYKTIEISQKEIVDKFRTMGKKTPITITLIDNSTLNNGVEQPKKEILKNPKNPNEVRVVKGYITNAIGKNEEPTKESFMNEYLMHDVSFQATDEDFYTMGKKSEMIFKINPIALKDKNGRPLKIKSITMGMDKSMAKQATLLEGTTDTYVLGYPTQFVLANNVATDYNLYMEVDFGEDVKIEGFPNPYIASFKIDWNGDYKGMVVEEPEKRVTPTIPDTKFDERYTITGVSYSKSIVSGAVEDLVINVSPKITIEDIRHIQSVKINGTEFVNGKDADFLPNRDFMIYTNDKKAIEKAQEKDEISVEVIFKNGKKLTYKGKQEKPQKEFVTNSNYGIAKKYPEKAPIDSVKIEEDINKVKYLNINIASGNKINTDEVKTITVNGVVFDAKEVIKKLSLNNSALLSANEKASVDVISMTDPEVIKAALLKNPIEVMITFTDGSSISRNMDVKMPDSYKEGDYTLLYSAYQKGTKEISTLAGYFDTRVKLHVDKDGKKTLTFLNHTFADLMIDFAIEVNGQYQSLSKKEIKDPAGKIKAVEYTIQLDSIDGLIGAAVLGSGPMGGSMNLIGSYKNDLYKKVDIEFSKQIIPGWSDFKYNEEKQKAKNENRSKLINALQDNNVVVDENMTDEQIRAALRVAKGKTLQKPINDDIPTNNVLNLENSGITDISLLDELGDEIKVLNLDGNKLETLPIFKKAKGLQYILLGGNQIYDIKAGTFDNVPKLEYLQLDGNLLNTLPNGIFAKNDKLKMLSLMSNAISYLPDNLLEKNTKLEKLYLQENNIKTLHDDFFKNNSRLIDVFLYDNQLEKLPSSLGTNKVLLKKIFAQYNNIEQIPESLKNLNALSNLDVSYNKIKSVPEGLIEKMISLASSNKEVSIDLSYNDIKNINFDKLSDALQQGGGKLLKFNLNMNYLPIDLTVEQENKLKNLGVRFDDAEDIYYPQKTSINPVATASAGKINLTQDFDILEMLYWDIADSVKYGGESIFKTNEDFKEYLLHKGRDYNKVIQSIPRDEAIQQILDKKGMKWQVKTIITKNGVEIYNHTQPFNSKDGISQVFDDNSMKKGDRYVISKTLILNSELFGMVNSIRYSTEEFIAQSDASSINADNMNQIGIKVNKTNSQTESAAKGAFKDVADYQEKDGKHIYSIYAKEQFSMFGMKADVKIPTITVDGVDIVPTVEKVGDYNKYTITLDKRVEKVNAKFNIKTALMNMKQDADIIFDYSKLNVEKVQEKQILIDVLKTGKQEQSEAKDVFKNVADYKVENGKHIYSLYLKENYTMRGIDASVKITTIMVDGKEITPVVEKVGEYNKYTFELDKKVDKVSPNFEIGIKGAPKAIKQSADVVFNYENKSNTNQREVKSVILNTDGTIMSDVNSLFDKKVSIKNLNKKSGPFDLVEVTVAFNKNANQLADNTKTGVQALSVKLGGVWMDAKKVANNTFSFEMPAIMVKDSNEIDDTILDIRLKSNEANAEKDAKLLIDWNGNFSGKVDEPVKPNPNEPTKPEEPKPNPKPVVENDFEKELPVWIKHETKDEPSIANSAINKIGRVSKKDGKYKYIVKIGSMQVGALTGNVNNVDVLQSGVSLVSSNNGEYVFESNEKLDRILVRFTIDAMGENRPNAYIMFNWDNSPTNSMGGSGGSGGGSGLPEMKKLEETTDVNPSNQNIEVINEDEAPKSANINRVNKKLTDSELIKKAEKIIKLNTKDSYNAQTVKDIEKSLKDFKNKVEGSRETLENLVNTASIERMKNVLADGYMKGNNKNEFMPNKNITRAEISIIISNLIDDDFDQSVKYKDVLSGKWYTDSMNKLINLGYINESGNGKYTPNKDMTRGEVAYVIAKLLNLPVGDENFKDVPKEHMYAKYIAACKQAGIISGYKDGTFKPNKLITRAEVTVIINRTFELQAKPNKTIKYKDVKNSQWSYKDIVIASKK